MRYVFKCIHQGWDAETEGIWFDAEDFTLDEAWKQFKEVKRQTLLDNGHWVDYTAYEYEGELFYKVFYLGLFEDDNMPMSDYDLWENDDDYYDEDDDENINV